MIRSASRSAFETKSPGPLDETCRFSTSRKSLTSERPALRAQINGFAAACVLCTGFFDGCLQGRCHHNHAGAAAKWAIVDVAQFIVGKAARVDGVELP